MSSPDTTNPLALRALAHPFRLRILQYVGARDGTTATQVSEALGESVASCSYHLRLLAKYGFVRPAEKTGGGREKPWVTVPYDIAVKTSELSDADRARANVMARADRQAFFAQLQRWADETNSHTPAWQNASFSVGYGLRLTPDEVVAMRKEIQAVVDSYWGRDKDRPGAAQVRFQAWGFPTPDQQVTRGDDS